MSGVAGVLCDLGDVGVMVLLSSNGVGAVTEEVCAGSSQWSWVECLRVGAL